MQGRRRLPSTGSVIGVIALVVAMGGAAYAGSGFGKTVNTGEIAKNAVTSPKLHAGAVRSPKIAADAVKGADVDEGSLGPVPSAAKALNVLAVTVRSDGTLARAAQEGTSASRTGEGNYVVDFGVAVSGCTYIASLGGLEGEPSGEISTSLSTTNAVAVHTNNSNGASADRAFSLSVVC
jgi:hypothetical protein